MSRLAAGILFCLPFLFLAHPQTQAPQERIPTPDVISFRIVFGYQRAAVKPYGGSITVTGGALRGIEPWRFGKDDAIVDVNSWKLEIKRTVFENQPDMPQPLSGGETTQNIVPAGLIVT